jgi:D-arabinitol 4-dehydrogenase
VLALAANSTFWAELAGDPRLVIALQGASHRVSQFMAGAKA